MKGKSSSYPSVMIQSSGSRHLSPGGRPTSASHGWEMILLWRSESCCKTDHSSPASVSTEIESLLRKFCTCRLGFAPLGASHERPSPLPTRTESSSNVDWENCSHPVK